MIIVIGIIVLIASFIVGAIDNVDETVTTPQKYKVDFYSPNYNKYRDGTYLPLLQCNRAGYTMFTIKGLNFYITKNNYGVFNGYAEALKNNPYDPFAIGIFHENGKQIGHLPKGNKKLYDYIVKEGGRVHAYGYCAKFIEKDKMYGDVCVETDKNKVQNRNKQYQTSYKMVI